jgi:hypothetical protein
VEATAPPALPQQAAATADSFEDFDPRAGALAPEASHDSAFDSPPPITKEDSFNPRAGEAVAAGTTAAAADGDLADFEAFLESQETSK